KRPYCLKLCPATGTLAPNLIYSTKPFREEKYYIPSPLILFSKSQMMNSLLFLTPIFLITFLL
ncbi:hypothetical protein, partial [Pantoea ananatis]